MPTTFCIRQRTRKIALFIGVGFSIFLLSLCLVTPVRAASLSPQVLPAANPADQRVACNGLAQDEASLNQAIACINLADSGSYTIEVTADIFLTQPSSPITNSVIDHLAIVGNHHTMDAQGHGRVLDIQFVKQLTVRDLTLRGGNVVTATTGIVPDWGGGLRYYCGEGQSCTGLLTNVTLVNNQAGEGGGFAMYCYVDTTCATTLIDSAVMGNAAQRGGGISSGFDEENFAYALQVTNSVVEGNRAAIGGGIFLRGATLTTTNSTIRDNVATSGGGLALVSSDYYLHVNLQSSTLSGNTATLRGGGIYVRSTDPGDVDLQVSNSTLSGNRVTDSTGIGGAIAISSTYGTGVALRNNTIVSNTAQSGAGIYIAVDDDSFAPASLVSFGNSIIAGNQTGGDCTGWLGLDHGKGVQLFTSLGHNLDSDGTCLSLTVRQASDLPNATANLGHLTDNGGATFTHALLPGSQALDAGDDALCTAATINGVDQRGAVRPQGAHCDIGAYERPASAACAYPILSASNEATLRQAIDCLNVAAGGAYTLAITADITYSQPMFRLANPALTTVVLAGNSHTLDARGHGRVLTLRDIPALTVRDLTLTGGKLTANTPFPPNGGGVAFDCTRDVLCQWTLHNTIIRNNQAVSGAGIDYSCDAGDGGALVIKHSVIRDNIATGVGGGLLYSTDEDSLACSVTLRNTLVEGNQAQDGGGLRIARPRVTVLDSIIRNNRATQVGGGLMARISDGYIDMLIQRSTISGNAAGVSGGGVYIASPDQRFDIKFVNSTISGNSVDNGMGGGLYLQETEGSLQIALINSTVTQNGASQGAGVQIFDRAEAPAYYTSTLRLTNSIIADNLGSDCTGTAGTGITFTGQRVLSFGNNLDSDGSCLSPDVRQASDIPNGNANLGSLADNGGPTPTHALLAGSQALDAGNDAVCAAALVNGVDQRSVQRPQGARCDIGAFEGESSPSPVAYLFVSSHSSGKAGNVQFRDEDIVTYAFATSTWQMVFDGSDVGVTKDVDAFVFRPDGSVLLSFNAPTDVPGLGKVDDADIVQFTPTKLGSDTAGSFALYLRGADVGLTTDGEDIDAIGFSSAGHLVVSTIGDFTTPSASGKDEDLIELDGGTWRLFMDGSTVGLANEDVNGLWLDTITGERYLTVKDSFAFDGQAIDADDIFVCTPTPHGGCTYRRFWDSDIHDYGAENLDGIGLGALPASLVASGQGQSSAAFTPDEAVTDDDLDDINLEELINRLFLPFVQQ